MINGLVNALKSINTTVYHSKIEIQRLNYAHNFLLTLADMLIIEQTNYIMAYKSLKQM